MSGIGQTADARPGRGFGDTSRRRRERIIRQSPRRVRAELRCRGVRPPRIAVVALQNGGKQPAARAASVSWLLATTIERLTTSVHDALPRGMGYSGFRNAAPNRSAPWPRWRIGQTWHAGATCSKRSPAQISRTGSQPVNGGDFKPRARASRWPAPAWWPGRPRPAPAAAASSFSRLLPR